MPVRPTDSFLRWVQTCMRVELNQTKNGLSALTARSRKSVAWPKISLSIVGMRSLESGPVSSIFCLPTLPHFGSTVGIVDVGGRAMEHAPRPVLLLELGVLGVVIALRLLFGVQVVEIAEEFVEAVHGRQVLVVVAQVVLAELAGRVALRP